jgi:phage terminase small subunit
LLGTYRPDRHANRIDETAVAGTPQKPDWLDADAAWLWDLVCNGYQRGILKEVDTAALAGACRWWAEWRKWDRELAAGAENRYKTTVGASMAWTQFSKIAGRLGLSPSDRTKLRQERPVTSGGVASRKRRAHTPA